MATYTTIQGDTWDMIAYRLFGGESYMKNLIEANWPHINTLVFSAGTELTVPEIPDEADDDLPFWRSDDAEDDSTFSQTEGGDDDE